MRIDLIVTLVGQFSRFKKENYITPKFLLPTYNGKFILEEIIYNFSKQCDEVRTTLVINKELRNFMTKSVIGKLRDLTKLNVVYEDLTQGQAETARIGIAKHSQAYPTEITPSMLVVTNGDSISHSDLAACKDIFEKLGDCVSVIDVFESQSNDYSYVVLDDAGRVESMKEKEVVSALASTGTHFYRSVEVFRSLYDATTSPSSEYHLSRMVDENCRRVLFKTTEIKGAEHFLDLGTPQKYLKYLKTFSHE
jgi:NDP-sugar pyrophosphorylase family protein